MLSFINKIFGSKSARDVKSAQPLVDKIKVAYEQLGGLSHDELRAKTAAFRARIKSDLSEIDSKIATIKKDVEENAELTIHDKTDLYDEVDRLEKDRNKQLEATLLDILPEAFAVMKETAKRFTDNETIEVTASEFDRELAARKPNVLIKGDKAIHHNSWLAAGTEVKWNMVHYDVQLIGGIVLHEGKIAEMATGEGKTLVGTLPIYLNALSGEGIHVVTVNDYLARRDSEWNGPIFEFHGLAVDCIDKHQPNSPQRRKAYQADVVYGTNNEFGFDYLRDNMTRSPEELVQGKLHYAIVDEVDSVLIDDARTPLIISGPIPKGDEHEFYVLKPRIERLVNAQKNYVQGALNEAKKLIAEGKTGPEEGEGGLALFRAYRGLPKNKALIKFLSESGMKTILNKTENYYMQDQNKEMPKADAELFFVIDEKNNQVELSEKGIELITSSGEDPHFFVMPDVGTEIADIEKSALSNEDKAHKKDELIRDFSVKSERIHAVNQLLKAYTLFEKDTEYIIDEGKVKIVDEQTGRIMDGRRYSDGLHQAIEAKENVKVEDATQTYATITLQNYFRMYHKLAGMTGTAVTEAGELWQIYKLDVVEIPTNRPIVRDDRQDKVYRTTREKYNAVAEEIVELTQAGRPVLVGTTSVEISELLSRTLKMRGIKHNVLNAKLHQKEADIVAEAGKPGQVTIATNMAGRGTDIKLGEGVKATGGLAIVGTERHESRRVDRQLRGRSGRQGDPGSTQFFVSLEDNLMRLFGSERIAGLMVRMGIEEGEVIQHSMITNSIERAQKKVEENNFGIRKRLLEYDDVMNSQRSVIYTKRKNALFGERLDVDIENMILDVTDDIVTEYKEEGNFEGFQLELLRIFAIDTTITEDEFTNSNIDKLADKVFIEASTFYKRKSEAIAQQAYPVIKDVFDTRGESIENIIVPFTDGTHGIQVAAPLKKSVETKGKEVVKAFEKTITLSLIDDTWKEHLREMDDLKQSVQNAVYEQKDPLVVYKVEAFNLFKGMLSVVNKDVVSFLFKGGIPVQGDAPLQEARPQPKTDMSKLKISKPEMGQESNGVPMDDTREVQKTQPIRVENKIGRNDPCPCGSGKKYKNCHGVTV
ncbi:MAG: preprotein translocase subunit SecA [Bacteroidetes bacterium]|nr:preprotein translocase subunit SecA [Bacteroidota bacterium]MBU1371555.1 preprotein translocase subunit SecA [Bacteroidota bacterium]MBU1486137.1 preprotein translocase subunit SecA [Bacteroidota bacterium]MBU1759566.1 preprotein translocase subunit SecA [Bacteroidota bacterium]MBU2046750.1 preprotein translocase subunit SecA [Bacteroidota bacterium]